MSGAPAEGFDALIGFEREGERWTRSGLPASWLQGRTLFGGGSAAACVRAARGCVDAERRLRSVQVAFVGPVVDAPTTLRATPVREGRSVSTWAVELLQEGTCRTRVTAVYGVERASTVAGATPMVLPARGVDDADEMPYLPGITPAFTQHIAMRWAEGALPFTGAEPLHLAGWCRHRTAASDPATALLALIDAWPCPALAQLKQPAPASSLTWQVSFTALPETLDPTAWWAFRSEVTHLADGFAHMIGTLASEDGRVVARSDQLVAIYG